MTTSEAWGVGIAIALFIIGFAFFLMWVHTRPVSNDRPKTPKEPSVQPDLVGERFWSHEERDDLLHLVERLHRVSGEVLEGLKTDSEADCGHLILELLPRIAWQTGERYIKIIEGEASQNLGIWYQAQDGRWFKDLEMVRRPRCVSMLGRRIMTINDDHERLQLNAGPFDLRWDKIAWKPMETLPDNTWVVLRHEGADGDEMLVTGYMLDGVRHTVTVYNGYANGGVDHDDFKAYGYYLAWAPLLVNNL